MTHTGIARRHAWAAIVICGLVALALAQSRLAGADTVGAGTAGETAASSDSTGDPTEEATSCGCGDVSAAVDSVCSLDEGGENVAVAYRAGPRTPRVLEAADDKTVTIDATKVPKDDYLRCEADGYTVDVYWAAAEGTLFFELSPAFDREKCDVVIEVVDKDDKTIEGPWTSTRPKHDKLDKFHVNLGGTLVLKNAKPGRFKITLKCGK